MSALRIGVCVVAAAAVTLAGASVVVAPHEDPPGTLAVHVHGLGLHRFPLALALPAPVADEGSGFGIADPLAELAGTLVFALLLFAPFRPWRVVPRAPERAPRVRLGAPQCPSRIPAPPPRVLTLRATR